MHQRGHDRLGVKLPFGAQAGNGYRMGDVGLTAGTVLAEVRFVGETVRVPDPAYVGWVQVIKLDGQRVERGGGCIGRNGGSRRSPPRALEGQSFLDGFDGWYAHSPNLSLIDCLGHPAVMKREVLQ